MKKEDKILLWENYWLEYINAFDNLINILPNSIVTVYVGRHTIEIGIKYLLLKKIGYVKNEHNLGILSNLLKDKSCLKYSINKKNLEQKVKDEIMKNYDIEQLDRKTLNELIDMIYIIDKNNIKIGLKNV